MEKTLIYAVFVLVIAAVGLTVLTSIDSVNDFEILDEILNVTEGETAAELQDASCVVSGCSNEICAETPMLSDCSYKKEYDCLKYSRCSLGVKGCSWEETVEYTACLKALEIS